MNTEFEVPDPWAEGSLVGLKIYNVSQLAGASRVAAILIERGADVAISREDADVVISSEEYKTVLGYDRGGSVIFTANVNITGDLFPGERERITKTLARLVQTRAHKLPD